MGCVYAKQSPAAASAQMQMQMHRHMHFHRCGSSNNNGNGVSATCASRSSSTKHSGRFQAEILEAATTQAQDDENGSGSGSGNGNGNGGVQDENEKDIVIVARSRRYANACVLNPVKCNTQAEQLAAGWPSWLTTVACEAIRGWIPRKADSFEKLDKIGQGTYSNVYKARDLESGKIVALKKVRFDNLEPESVRFMAREIQVLRRLDHPNVVKLEGLVTSRMSCSLYLVFEYMDHDLAGLGAHPGIKFTESQVKCFMQQLLCGLDHCHVNGVLHRDIKGSNLLIDNDGILKIADFGLATFFSPGQKQPLTSRVVTLWYRPPELLLGATEYGVGVDLWSAGCLLAELLNGKPILPGRTEVEQLHKIFKLCGSPSDEYWKKTKLPHATIFKPQQPYRRCISETFKDFPPSALSLTEKLLSIEVFGRGTAASALKSEFFLTKPFACAPSCLPKYPPCKELDVKIRDDEARRNRITVKRGLLDVAKRAHRESKAVPAPDGNAELITSIQKRRLESQSNLKSQSEMFSSQEDDGAVGFPIDPPRALDAGKGPCASNTQMPMTKGNIENDRLSDNIQRDSVSVFPNKTHSSFVKENQTLEKANGSQPALGSLSDCSITSKAGPSCWDLSNDDKEHSNHVDKYEDLSSSSQKCAEKKGNMEIFSGHDNQDDRVEFSGPLLSQSANIDKLLERHERQIQQAVRRVRHDKSRIPKNALSHTRRKLSEYRNWISRGHGSTTYDLCTRPNVGEVKGKA